LNSTIQPTDREIQELLNAMAGCRVAVIGDVMLDEYLIGPVQRISPEAPVPVLEIEHESCNLGGAANVATCLAALGAEVRLVGVVGTDTTAIKLNDKLREASVDASGLVADATRPTTCKTRIVARQQQVVRLDRESRRDIEGDAAREMIARACEAAAWADVVVLSDYAKGVLTEEVCQAVIGAAKTRPVIVDPKALPWDRYRGATVVKPNRDEMQRYCGEQIDTDEHAAAAAQRLANELDLTHALMTRSAAGMTSVTRGEGEGEWIAHHVKARRRELIDVTGAGDVTSAVVALAIGAGASMGTAMWLANLAAGVKVEKFGATTVSPSEILSAASSGHREKILSVADAAAWAAGCRAQGKRVVFTNGCFDLLHVGHVQYLEDSRRLGDALIVGLNSDASVQRLKGPTRPVQSQADRGQILGSLSTIDAVTIFDEDTPLELIRAIRPDVITKGKDYREKQAVVGWDLVESWGGSVELIEFVAGRSTTKLISQAAA